MENKLLVSLIGVLVSLSSIVMICDAGNLYTVGDEKGWTLGVDYQVWAQGKQFHVGDSIGNLISLTPSSNLIILVLLY